MEKLQNESKHLFLIVKYEPIKVMWRILFPYLLIVTFGFSAGWEFVVSGNIFIGMFFYGIGLLGMYGILDLLMTIEFVLYNDKIVKVSKLFSPKEIKYSDAILGITMVKSNPVFNSLSAYSFYKKVICFNMHIYNKHISIDRRLISKSIENEITSFVSKLLSINIQEQYRENNILKFDLKDI